MTNDKTVTMSRELAERISARLERLNAGFCELRALLAAPVVERQPLPITEGMDRLMEAYRLGEFRLEGGSPTVEAMSCKSFDEHEIALQAYDFESYAAGYQAAMYEEASSLLGHIACLDKVKELNQC